MLLLLILLIPFSLQLSLTECADAVKNGFSSSNDCSDVDGNPYGKIVGFTFDKATCCYYLCTDVNGKFFSVAPSDQGDPCVKVAEVVEPNDDCQDLVDEAKSACSSGISGDDDFTWDDDFIYYYD